MAGTNAFALHEKLREVLRATIGNSPFPVFYAEGRSLLLALFSTISGCFLGGRLFFSALLTNGFLLSERWLLWLFENLIFNLILIDVFLLSLVLQPDDTLHLADMFLYHE
jgi:hypothetical protein